jgi:hypothetical protein
MKLIRINMHFYQEKKHSNRYRADNMDAAISDVYIKKDAAPDIPQHITLTIEEKNDEDK